MNNSFADFVTGAKLITAITDSDELGEVTAQLRQLVERLETRLNAIPDEPVAPEPVIVEAERAPEPRQPRVYFTGRMAV